MPSDSFFPDLTGRGTPTETDPKAATPPEDPGLIQQVVSFFSGGENDNRFQKSGPLGLTSGESARLRPDEKTLLSGLAEEGYAPSQVVPMEGGSGSQAARYTLPEQAAGPIKEGAIQVAPIRESAGEAARYNARARSGADVLAEEVAHDLTLSDTTASQEIAREVANRHAANADSLASLMTTSFGEQYSDRPQEKVAKSMTPAVQAIGGVQDSSTVDPMQLDLAGQLIREHGGAGENRESLLNLIQSRKTGVEPAQQLAVE